MACGPIYVCQVERLTLEVEWAGHPSVAPRDQMASRQAVWKPNPVAMWLPPETPATKVCSALTHTDTQTILAENNC